MRYFSIFVIQHFIFYKDMNIQDFIDNFSSAIEVNNTIDLSSDTIFWEIEEWSSLAALSVVSMIDEEYGVTLRSADVKGVKTIGELFDIVREKSR